MSLGSSYLRHSVFVTEGEAYVSNIFQIKQNQQPLTTFAKLSVCFDRDSMEMEDYNRVEADENRKLLTPHVAPIKKYLTGSRYAGEINKLGFIGKGVYRYPHGVYYKGHFNNRGEFHGVGQLLYPMGQKIEGVWKHGVLQSGFTFTNSSGQVMDENMKYCHVTDRRYDIEIENDFAPVGNEYIQPQGNSLLVPEGCYDIIEGVYSPTDRFVLFEINRHTVKKILTHNSFSEVSIVDMEDGADEEFRKLIKYTPSTKFEIRKDTYIKDIPIKPITDLITRYCKNSMNQPVGYSTSLYPIWMAGRKYELFDNGNSQLETEDFSEVVRESVFTTPKKMYSFIQRPGKRSSVSATDLKKSLLVTKN